MSTITMDTAVKLSRELSNTYIQLFDLLYLDMPEVRKSFIENMLYFAEKTGPLEMAKEMHSILAARLEFLTTKI